MTIVIVLHGWWGNLVTIVSKKLHESFFGFEAQHYTHFKIKVNTRSLSWNHGDTIKFQNKIQEPKLRKETLTHSLEKILNEPFSIYSKSTKHITISQLLHFEADFAQLIFSFTVFNFSSPAVTKQSLDFHRRKNNLQTVL
jgi:hypothetical protein